MTDPNKICFVCMGELQSEGCICPSCGHDNRLRGNGPGFLKSTVLGGQYFVGKVLGRGGFGITYLGLDLLLNRKVAIKEYFPEGVAYRDSETEKVVEMNLLNTTIGKRELAVSFARRFSEIDDSQVEAIRRILMEGENG